MKYQNLEFYFLLALLAIIGTLAFFIFEPFLYALILALLFATVFAPVHKKSLAIARGKNAIAALLTTMFVLIVIVVPVALLGIQIFKEATGLYTSIATDGEVASFSQGIEGIVRSLGIPFLPATPLDIGQYAKQGLSWLIQNLGPLFSNIAKIVVDLFVLLAALYFLFKDGEKLKKSIIAASPLRDAYDEIVISKLEVAVNSVVRGRILVGLVQGVFMAVGLAVFGVPNPVLWGSVAAIVALVPGVGTSLVLIPAILFLLFVGETNSAIGLLAWGVLAVGLVDNILGPKLVERGVQLHPFLILLSIFGGVSFFGPLGLLFGPLTLSLLLAVLDIYSSVRKENSK